MRLHFPRRPGGPARRAGRLAFGLIIALLGLPALVPRPAGAAPLASQGSPSLVFSEVYAPLGSSPQTQWFEIHNTQPRLPYALNGLIVATGQRQVTLQTPEVIGPAGYVLFVFSLDALRLEPLKSTLIPGAKVVPVLGLQGLAPQADALILKTPDNNLVIDQVNWGAPDRTWPNFNADLWTPGLDPLDPAQCPTCTWGRTPADQDTNQPHTPAGDWTLHETPSPGGRVPPVKLTAFLNDYTNVASALGSLLLWVAFIIVGIIAYRFERLRDTRTYWQLLLLAPSGLLFYTIIVISGFSNPGAALSNDQKWLSFPVLALSALVSLVAVGIFRSVARTLLEGE